MTIDWLNQPIYFYSDHYKQVIMIKAMMYDLPYSLMLFAVIIT